MVSNDALEAIQYDYNLLVSEIDPLTFFSRWLIEKNYLQLTLISVLLGVVLAEEYGTHLPLVEDQYQNVGAQNQAPVHNRYFSYMLITFPSWLIV